MRKSSKTMTEDGRRGSVIENDLPCKEQMEGTGVEGV